MIDMSKFMKVVAKLDSPKRATRVKARAMARQYLYEAIAEWEETMQRRDMEDDEDAGRSASRPKLRVIQGGRQ